MFQTPDRTGDTSSSYSGSSFTLLDVPPAGSVGVRPFSTAGVTSGNLVPYEARDASGNWETHLGAWTAGALARASTPVASSNAGAQVTFSGTVNITVCPISTLSGTGYGCYQWTDSTDVAVAYNTPSSPSTISSTRTIWIPSDGHICLSFDGKITGSAGSASAVLGLVVDGSTYLYCKLDNNGSVANLQLPGGSIGTGLYKGYYATAATGTTTSVLNISLNSSGLSAGFHTVQPCMYSLSAAGLTIKGTTNTTVVRAEICGSV